MEADLFGDNTLARDKATRALGILRKVYYESSNVEKLVRVRDAKADEKDLRNLYFRHLIPKEWFTKPEYYIDVVFEQFAANLAISEEKYIIDRIFEAKNIPTRNLGQNVLENFIDRSIKFLMSMRCWVHPFCYVPPSRSIDRSDKR
jgi:hypothetical protein